MSEPITIDTGWTFPIAHGREVAAVIAKVQDLLDQVAELRLEAKDAFLGAVLLYCAQKIARGLEMVVAVLKE